MIDLRLFRIPSFSASLVINFLAIFVAVGYFLFVAQYLQLVVGLSPLQAGLWSVPSAIGFIVGSNLAPRIVQRVRPAYVMGGGLAIAAVGLAHPDPGQRVRWPRRWSSSGSVVISLGLGPVLSLTTELIVGSAPPERAGAASGISETGAELGGALGISILGSIGIAIYRSDVATGSLPASRRRPRPSPATRSAAPSASPVSCPARSARPCSRWLGRRSSRGCRWPPASAPSWPSRSPSSPWSPCAT